MNEQELSDKIDSIFEKIEKLSDDSKLYSERLDHVEGLLLQVRRTTKSSGRLLDSAVIGGLIGLGLLLVLLISLRAEGAIGGMNVSFGLPPGLLEVPAVAALIGACSKFVADWYNAKKEDSNQGGSE